ncbi:DNA alkylation repair protein [Agromyces sp. MMS24-JH15]|uniref:DNA alkylation repair protein n=1 Tax=Agromyces sp. MMS24-JH15 TaxID=3243765 RepID=UPI0037482680
MPARGDASNPSASSADGPSPAGSNPDAQDADGVVAALAEVASAERAASSAWFFKSGPGGYAEGDRFIGVTVPMQRGIARRFADLPQDALDRLLESPIHEHRLTALLIMVDRFRRAGRPHTRDDDERLALHRAYVRNVDAGRVDNWDLVDASAEYLLGEVVYDEAPAPVSIPPLVARLAASDSLWSRRVAMIATFAATKAGDPGPALAVAGLLLEDREDLIRKAVGWMLREVGKRADRDALVAFLDANAARMPRVALSYATEHFAPDDRARWRGLR